MIDSQRLNSVIKKIKNKQAIDENIWLEILLQQDVDDRLYVNKILANVFMEVKDFKQARIHAERVCILSGFEPTEVIFYVNILENLNEVEAIVETYKSIGMAEKKRNRYESSINYFQKAWHARAFHEKKDNFKYDFDILDSIYQMAQPYKNNFASLYEENHEGSKKIKIAYLVYGLADIGSVFGKFIPLFAKYHNHEEFEVTFFIPNRTEWILSQDHSAEIVKNIENFGCRVVCASNEPDRYQRWLYFSEKIAAYRPHFFITFAGLACLEYYFIASTLPKYIQKIALVYGPPSQFIPPTFDLAMGNTEHPMLDSPIKNSFDAPVLVEKKYDFDKKYKRDDFRIPVDSVVICSSGRYTKFQENIFWEILLETMSKNSNVYFLCIGPYEEDVNQIISWSKSILQRCRFLGWQDNVSSILGCADIYMNTFPNGGGHTIIEAVEQGLPVISFRHNYFQKFDQRYWNPISDFIDVKELLIPQWNMTMFISTLQQLINDSGFKESMAQLCLESIRKKIPNSQESMQNYEAVLKNMVL